MNVIARRAARVLPLWVLAAVVASCATAGAPEETLGDPELILREEIEESTARNAFELVQTLRPQWLRTRGLTNLRQAGGVEDIVIYMDNARLGYPEELRRVPLAAVEYLEFFDAREATQRWGGGHIHGAILVSTRAR
ncbi:MAG TPA: hypothetical protein VFQ22_10635 [Longimicrobiales bacterium]|nr:hypothetical protein [Longimicrobiales bacterium]